MNKAKKELTKLRGVGSILAARFIEAGLDTFEKVVAAGEEGLKKIKGINPRSISGIIAQAAGRVDEGTKESEKKLAELRERSTALAGRVQEIAAEVKDRFSEEISGKTGKKIEKQVFRIIGSLEAVAAEAGVKRKRAAKSLARAEKHLAMQSEAGLKEIRKSLKKARKSLKRIIQ